MFAKSAVLFFWAAGMHPCGAAGAFGSANCVTHVAQFKSLSGADFLAGCDFHLTGVVTLVDTNRDLLVLQDATGAVALNFRIEDNLRAGQLVTLLGTNCCPMIPSFPNYPYRPSVTEILGSSETPSDWGEYNLTRLRGFLRPQVTGEYKFWIASDNSSELWLSADAEPSKARKIASISRFDWVSPRDWSRFPSQHSDLIHLTAGETYYIEALQEQSTVGENLSVAWQGPLPNETAISVIAGRYLTPWSEDRASANFLTNGILREIWTNYSAGNLSDFERTRPFASALSVQEVRAQIHGQGEWPKPSQMILKESLPVEDNYRWMRIEGVVNFKATDGKTAFLELSDGQAALQVRVEKWSQQFWKRLTNVTVQVEGVCEEILDQNGALRPGLMWVPGEINISLVETTSTNSGGPATDQTTQLKTATIPAIQGFYSTRGVVTFNDQVFGNDYVFVQEDNAVVRVALNNDTLKKQFKVGQGVDMGGALEPGKLVSIITPLVVTKLGWHSMPALVINPVNFSSPENLEGKWTELEGVVRSVNPNGTLSIVGKFGSAYLWIGRPSSNSPARYVDAKLRVRGVLMLSVLDAPLLLVPSHNFIDIEEGAPENPFAAPRYSIAKLLSKDADSMLHRKRVAGEITYRDAQSFFVQDTSGGIRVQTAVQPAVKIGDPVEVVAFLTQSGSAHILTNALVRPAAAVEHVSPKDLDLSETFSTKQGGTLVHVSATLLASRTNGMNQVLELQEQQRVFTATFAANQGGLPVWLPGSQFRITGVCDDETAVLSTSVAKPPRVQLLSSLNILLRTPQDVVVVSGPPWWTWKRTATMVGMLLTILAVALLWVHLLRRRLERQQAAQLAFSRQVLERLEDERRRIAVNLHDSLGQTLLVIKNHAILAIQRPPEEQGLRHRLDEISGATSQAIEEVRRITHGLRPYQLDRLGLTQAIRASVSRASENSSILFASRVKDIDSLFDKDAEIHVYRIVQESITNVVKHSAATEATVVIMKRASVVSLSIRDNGRGFDPAKPSSEPRALGYGLSGIAERVRILGGTLVIESRRGEGTSLTVEIPIPISKI